MTDGQERRWARIAAAYRRPDPKRSLLQLATTAVPLAALWLAMVQSLDHGYWLTLLLAVPAAGLLVRLFMIQHDCGHGSFFRSRRANDLLGRLIGTFTLTPYDYWRQAHAVHHATSGNLDRRGVGDVSLLTVREYLSLPRWRRLGYRLYRHPLVLFGLGPTYLFVIKHRLPLDMPRGRKGVLASVLATNLAILAFVLLMGTWIGFADFLSVQAPITVLASSIGVWLFYIQHQFERTYWDRDESWTFHHAAVRGSSYYDLPRVLRWFTANIGVHHIHHLCSMVPSYRLQECLDDHPELRQVNRLTLRQSLRCVRLALWDEDQRRLVSFRTLRSAPPASMPASGTSAPEPAER